MFVLIEKLNAWHKYQYYGMQYYVGFYVADKSIILFIFYECQFVKHSKACFGFLILNEHI
jgi:hypothetical protein